MQELDRHAHFLQSAIELSRSCPVSSKAFSVGAIITDRTGAVIATGFSREQNPEEHAEELAIRRALAGRGDLASMILYSSMEPCSIRLSGRRACTDRIIDCGIACVVFAMKEPPRFVNCQGDATLRANGIQVFHLAEFAPLVAEINQHLL